MCESVYKIYSRNVKARDILGRRLKCRWGVIIEMDSMEIGCEDVDWIRLPQDGVQWRGHLVRVIDPQIS
jgi:hypothetical protein